MQNDDIDSLANRIWRYHSFGYKLKKPSILKTIKLSLKQFKFFINRSIKDMFKFRFKFIIIFLLIFIKFIKLEHKYYKENKK